jgi:Domain of unknown function (DUF4416)
LKKFDPPQPVKLVCGLLYRDPVWLERGVADLKSEYGEIDFQSESFPFHFTDYYFEEMGQPLFRSFVGFSRLIDPAALAGIKVFTNSLEQKHRDAGGSRRALNIDPGYLTATAYILATSKNYAHRIYLGMGVFAQQELLFEKKATRTLEWTYPDYRSLEYQQVLRRLREMYLAQLRTHLE